MTPFRTLVVEDDAEKLRRITRVLGAVDPALLDGVDHVVDAHTAKLRLLKIRYDLLVLDIAIPPRMDADVNMTAGLDLLDEVVRRDKFKAPGFIVGITAHEDLLGPASIRFSEDLLSVVRYDLGTDLWEKQISACLSRLLATRLAGGEVAGHGVHVALVCALQDELQSNLENGWEWEPLAVAGDHTPYHVADVQVGDRSLRAVAAAATRMGMPTASALAMKMVAQFRPRYMGMTGVTAARRGRAYLGDVVVADPIWDWGSGKWVMEQGDPAFLPEPNQLPLDPRVRAAFQQIAGDHAVLGAIRREWRGEKPDRELQVRIGPSASGSGVVADDGSVLRRIEDQHRKVIGVDMEAYAVFAAAHDSPAPRPIAFTSKSVVDFADGTKDDSARLYALYTSAQVTRHFIEAYSAVTLPDQ